MLHARNDYDHIQDNTGKIADDEPVFLIRAKDVCAPEAVEAWAAIAQSEGADPVIVRTARLHAERMREWQNKTGLAKVPDIPVPATERA